MAAGRTPSQLAHAMEKRLAKYVKEPNVTVMVDNFVGPADRQIRVIGQVAQPIAIPYRDGLSLLDVMIAVKGLTPFAAGNDAVLVRREKGRPETFSVRLGDLLEDGDISQNVAMRPGDTLFIPEAWF
jgi:polysaccharide biosynthesis/export protein